MSSRSHARIQEFLPGGGGGGGRVQARLPENSSCNVVSLVFSPQLILQFYSGLSMVYFKENDHFPRFQREPNISRGGGSGDFFQGGGGGGSIETHITYDFLGVRTPYPHLDPHMDLPTCLPARPPIHPSDRLSVSYLHAFNCTSLPHRIISVNRTVPITLNM